jgi:hypothetical protein
MQKLLNKRPCSLQSCEHQAAFRICNKPENNICMNVKIQARAPKPDGCKSSAFNSSQKGRERHTHTEKHQARSPISRRLKTKRLRSAGVSFPELYSRARPLFNCYQLREHEEVLSVPGCNETIFHISLTHTHKDTTWLESALGGCTRGSRKLRRARQRPSHPGSAINRFQSQSAPQMQLRCISPQREMGRV